MTKMYNVDLNCAVNAKAFMLGARPLPVRGVAVCSDERPRDVCGRKRSPATFSSFRKGQKPANAGRTFPPTPPTEAQILAMLDTCPDNPAGRRLRALVVVLWRAGLRIHEALLLTEHELDRHAHAVTVLKGKGGKFGVSGMDDWAFEQVQPWIEERRAKYPPGPLFCICHGPTRGGRWSTSGARTAVRDLAKAAGLPRRCVPHQLRHCHASELAREGHPLIYISRQLRHTNVATTAGYLSSIGSDEAVQIVAGRAAPGASASEGKLSSQEADHDA
jgi:integrase